MAKKNEQSKSVSNQVLGLVIVALVAISGLFIINFSNNDSTNESSTVETNEQISQATSTSDGKVVTYYGVDDQNALALLKQYTDTETEEFSGLGEYVVSINGVASDSTSNYWAFYVNGDAAQVGAGEYETANGDVVEWRLEDVSTFSQ